MRGNIRDIEDGLSTWSDEVVSLQTTVSTSEVEDLKGKCKDLEGRMRRRNIRIVGVPEKPGSNSTTAVSKLLKETLQMDKDITIVRSHHSLGSRKPGDKLMPLFAKLHYDDCMEILRRAQDQAPLSYNGNLVAIYPDYTANVIDIIKSRRRIDRWGARNTAAISDLSSVGGLLFTSKIQHYYWLYFVNRILF